MVVTVHRSSGVRVRGGRTATTNRERSRALDIDADRHRVREHVVDGGSDAGLLHELAQLLGGRIALDGETHADLLVATADLAVEAEDALHVDVTLHRRGDLGQPDAASGGD